MATLENKFPALTYKDLLQVSNSNSGIDGTLRVLADGEGTASSVRISSDAFEVDNLNFNGNSIISINTGGDINITPDTTGDLVLDGLKWPQADGSSSQVIQTDGAGQLSFVAGGSSIPATLKTPITTGEDVTAGDILYLKSDGKVYKAVANTTVIQATIFGVAQTTKSSGVNVDITLFGVEDSFSVLTVGSKYYLDTTAGGVVSTPPSSSGDNVVEVGMAISATNMLISPKFIYQLS